MSDNGGYSEQEDIQDMIDRAVERDGRRMYVRTSGDYWRGLLLS